MKCDVSRLAAALRRRHVLVFTEQSAEVIDAAEADFFSDMCNVQFGLGNQFLGLVNAVLIQKFDKCPDRRLLESPAEMKSAHLRDGSRCRQERERAVQESGMGVPEFLRVVTEEAEARIKEAKLQEKK